MDLGKALFVVRDSGSCWHIGFRKTIGHGLPPVTDDSASNWGYWRQVNSGAV
jgi:hypothetical protein